MFINPEDWLDLDAFYLLYDKLKDKEIDICMYPLISFDGDSFYENGYYDFAGFDEYLKNNTFDYSDILGYAYWSRIDFDTNYFSSDVIVSIIKDNLNVHHIFENKILFHQQLS